MVGLATGVGRRTPDVSHRARPCIIRRISRPFDPSAGDARIGRHRMDARDRRTRGGLAHPPRRIATHRQNALASYFQSLGGEIITNTRVRSLQIGQPRRAHPAGRDAAPAAAQIAGPRLPGEFRRNCALPLRPRRLQIDWALVGRIPWTPPTARAQQRFISAERSKRSPPPNEPPPQGNVHERPFAPAQHSQAFSTLAARPPASTPRGLIATYRTR